jgi:hypothetical protein
MVIESNPNTQVPEGALFTTFGPAAQITKFAPTPPSAKPKSRSSLRHLPGRPNHQTPGLVGSWLRSVVTG